MPRNMAELVAGARETGAGCERLGRDTARALAAAKRSMAAFVRGIVALLRLDHFGGDVAGGRDRNDGIVEERDPGDVRANVAAMRWRSLRQGLPVHRR